MPLQPEQQVSGRWGKTECSVFTLYFFFALYNYILVFLSVSMKKKLYLYLPKEGYKSNFLQYGEMKSRPGK